MESHLALCFLNTEVKGKHHQAWHSRLTMLLFAFYCCDRTPWSKAAWGGKALFLESGTDARAVKKHCLLIFSVYLLQSRNTCLGMAPLTMGWRPPTSIVNQENIPQSCLRVNLMEAFSVEVPSPITLCQTGSTLHCWATGICVSDLFG